MLRFKLTVIAVVTAFAALAADEVTLEISEGIDNDAVRRNIEAQGGQLLTAINRAQSANSRINYSGIKIDELASQTLDMSWEQSPFRTEDNEIVTFVTTSRDHSGNVRGYQVRNIAVNMTAPDYTGETYQEINLDFDSRGNISDFNFTMPTAQYMTLLDKGIVLNDLYERAQIIHWCEQFAKAYRDKNKKFMEDVFSDDALIIVGTRKVDRSKSDVKMKDPTKVEYVQRTKREYLDRLYKIFDNNKYVLVDFDEYQIVRHGSKTQFYGVTLTQKWSHGNGNSSYSDLGTVFLVWDFTDPQQPKIHVRTWQDMQDPKRFSLGDFKLPEQTN